MKSMGSYLSKTLGMVIFTMPLALNASSDMAMKNVQIQNCSSRGETCVTVKSPQAQVSSVRSIYFMKDLEVEVKNSKGDVRKSVKTQGYLDFDSNQLVLQSIDKKGTLTEEVYNLITLQKQVFVTR